MTCSLIYCRLPTSLPPVPTFDAYPSSKKLNPKEFAMKMSMERRIAMGELDGANAANAGRKLIQMDKESEMFTTKPLYRKCNVAEKFLHDRPPTLSSVSLITCTILEESCFPRASPTILLLHHSFAINPPQTYCLTGCCFRCDGQCTLCAGRRHSCVFVQAPRS